TPPKRCSQTRALNGADSTKVHRERYWPRHSSPDLGPRANRLLKKTVRSERDTAIGLTGAGSTRPAPSLPARFENAQSPGMLVFRRALRLQSGLPLQVSATRCRSA